MVELSAKLPTEPFPTNEALRPMTAQIVCLQAHRDAKALADVSGLVAEKQAQERSGGMAAMLKRQEPRWSDHREESRHQVGGKCLPFVTVNGKVARLENVSRNGLSARSDLAAGVGSRVLVAIAGCQSLSARLIWKRDGKIGLEAPMASMSLTAI